MDGLQADSEQASMIDAVTNQTRAQTRGFSEDVLQYDWISKLGGAPGAPSYLSKNDDKVA